LVCRHERRPEMSDDFRAKDWVSLHGIDLDLRSLLP
jgi:hypothetical protein